MNAMNSLFGALPMPGSGGAATPPPEAALPALIPTGGSFDDDSWADVEAPEEDWGPEDAPPPEDEAAAAPTWEERQDEVSALVARAQASGVDADAAVREALRGLEERIRQAEGPAGTA